MDVSVKVTLTFQYEIKVAIVMREMQPDALLRWLTSPNAIYFTASSVMASSDVWF
jgi:hypothetical protein